MELQQLGWNLFTYSVIFIIILAILDFSAIIRQTYLVIKKDSTQSISVIFHLYWTFLFLCGIIYGLNNFLITVTATSFVMIFPETVLLIKLYRLNSYSKLEKYLTWILLVNLIIMAIIPYQDYYLLAATFINLFFSCTQAKEIINEKDSGNVSLWMLIIFSFGSFCWIIYANVMNIWFMKITQPLLTVIFVITTILWFIYRKKETPVE